MGALSASSCFSLFLAGVVPLVIKSAVLIYLTLFNKIPREIDFFFFNFFKICRFDKWSISDQVAF